jgi:hypothetical protein
MFNTQVISARSPLSIQDHTLLNNLGEVNSLMMSPRQSIKCLTEKQQLLQKKTQRHDVFAFENKERFLKKVASEIKDEMKHE